MTVKINNVLIIDFTSPSEGSYLYFPLNFRWNKVPNVNTYKFSLGSSPGLGDYTRYDFSPPKYTYPVDQITLGLGNLVKQIPEGKEFYATIGAQLGSSSTSWATKTRKYIFLNLNGRNVACAADTNRDKTINILDAVYIRSNYNKQVIFFARGDLNGDGVINIQDLILLQNKYKQPWPQGVVCK